MNFFEQITQQLEDALPHGSGIDCDWTFEVLVMYTRGSKCVFIKCSNSYHCMDDMGGYCGYADFSINIPIDSEVWDFDKVVFHGSGAHYLNRKYMLKEYLEDALDEHLRDYFKEN